MDKLLTRAPVNKQAAMHLAKNGEHYQPPRPENGSIASDVFLPFRAPTKRELSDPNYQDLTGIVWGRVVVMGVLDETRMERAVRPGAGGQKWVVRCVCGRFETRQSRTIKRRVEGGEACCDCKHTEKLRRGEVYGSDEKIRARLFGERAGS